MASDDRQPVWTAAALAYPVQALVILYWLIPLAVIGWAVPLAIAAALLAWSALEDRARPEGSLPEVLRGPGCRAFIITGAFHLVTLALFVPGSRSSWASERLGFSPPEVVLFLVAAGLGVQLLFVATTRPRLWPIVPLALILAMIVFFRWVQRKLGDDYEWPWITTRIGWAVVPALVVVAAIPWIERRVARDAGGGVAALALWLGVQWTAAFGLIGFIEGSDGAPPGLAVLPNVVVPAACAAALFARGLVLHRRGAFRRGPGTVPVAPWIDAVLLAILLVTIVASSFASGGRYASSAIFLMGVSGGAAILLVRSRPRRRGPGSEALLGLVLVVLTLVAATGLEYALEKTRSTHYDRYLWRMATYGLLVILWGIPAFRHLTGMSARGHVRLQALVLAAGTFLPWYRLDTFSAPWSRSGVQLVWIWGSSLAAPAGACLALLAGCLALRPEATGRRAWIASGALLVAAHFALIAHGAGIAGPTSRYELFEGSLPSFAAWVMVGLSIRGRLTRY